MTSEKHDSAAFDLPSGARYQADPDLIERVVSGSTLLIPVGEAAQELDGMLLLNETGAFLWDALQSPRDEDALVEAVMSAFDGQEAVVRADVRDFLQNAVQSGLVALC